MELPNSFTTIVETVRDSAGVDRVYGKPIERDGRTVVPVARIAYGFGGGFGNDSSPGAGTDEGDHAEGGGGGGGVTAKPVGALEITDENTRFVRFDSRNRLLGVFGLGIVVGWLLRRFRARGRTSTGRFRSKSRRESRRKSTDTAGNGES